MGNDKGKISGKWLYVLFPLLAIVYGLFGYMWLMGREEKKRWIKAIEGRGE